MTVTAVGSDDDGTARIGCTWFDEKGDNQSSSFPADAVEAF
jgi:uncharacterized protein YodC (DUF2158 family)